MRINTLYNIVNLTLDQLPMEMRSQRALAFLLAIARQESHHVHRRQDPGPARGYWQMEPTTVLLVFKHSASMPHLTNLLVELDYPESAGHIAAAIEFDVILAAALARLLLWTHPHPLPAEDDPAEAWRYYLDVWRPGRPRPEHWHDNWRAAWSELIDTTSPPFNAGHPATPAPK